MNLTLKAAAHARAGRELDEWVAEYVMDLPAIARPPAQICAPPYSTDDTLAVKVIEYVSKIKMKCVTLEPVLLGWRATCGYIVHETTFAHAACKAALLACEGSWNY